MAADVPSERQPAVERNPGTGERMRDLRRYLAAGEGLTEREGRLVKDENEKGRWCWLPAGQETEGEIEIVRLHAAG